MKKVMYHLNDYVVNAENKICRIVGTRLDYQDPESSIQYVTTLWVEVDDAGPIRHLEEVDSGLVSRLEYNRALLTKIGFHDGEGAGTMVYRNMANHRTLIIDRTDGSMYGYCAKRHIMLDHVYAESVHDIQHAFDAIGIDFPCLDNAFIFENMRRVPPIRLHNSKKNEP